MKKRIKAKWLKALRSGEYKQGRHRLRQIFTPPNEFQYCCLGVLCDLYQKETGNGAWTWGAFHVDTDTSAHFPPAAVKEWAGIDTDDQSLLAAYNDPFHGREEVLPGHSFKEIAELIETFL